MAKVSKECILNAQKDLDLFTDEELHEYAVKVIRKAEEDGSSIEEAMSSVGKEKLSEMFNRNSIMVKNMGKFEKLAEDIKNKTTDLAAIYIKRYKGLGRSVAQSQRHAQHELNEQLFGKMTAEEVVHLKDSNFRQDIFDAMDGKEDVNPLSKSIAEKIIKYKEYCNGELVNSTALPIENIKKNRFFGNHHNTSKILKGGRNAILSAVDKRKYKVEESKKKWVDKIKQHLNYKETFGGTKAENIDGTFNESKVDEIINNTFENITTGKNVIFTKSLVANDREALAKAKHQFYIFKDWSNWGAYDSVYGDGDLYTTLVGDIQSVGKRIGTARILGDSPYNMHLDLMKVQVDYGLPKVPSESLWKRNTEMYFNEIMGANSVPDSVTLANITANIKTLSAMPRLIKLPALSLNDSARVAAMANRWGDGYWGSLLDDLSHSFNLIPTELRKEAAQMMKFSLRNEFGYMGRYIDSANASEALQKFSGGFYRKIGLTALDNGKKVSAISMMMSRLGRNSHMKWDNLPELFKNQLEKYVDEHEWELIRKNTKKVGNNKVISLDSVQSITDEELKTLKSMQKNPLPLMEMRNEIHRKVFSLFDISAENAVLAPGEFERVWLTQGSRLGSPLGSLIRLIGQFKAYPLAGIDRVYVQRFLDKDSATSKIAWAAQMIAATSGISYLLTYFDYSSQGLSMPDVSKMNGSQATIYYLSMMEPTFMLLYKMMDTRKQGRDLAVEMMNSPGLKVLSNSVSTVLGVPYGNFKPAKQLLKDTFPIHTLPIIAPFVDEMLGEKPYLQPGQKKLSWAQ